MANCNRLASQPSSPEYERKICAEAGITVDGSRRYSPASRSAPLLRMPGDPARQRPPLLPILLGARARQVEHRQAVARAVHVDLRVAQIRHAIEVERLDERVEPTRRDGARVDAHADHADRKV